MLVLYFFTSLLAVQSLYISHNRRFYQAPNPAAAQSILQLKASGNTYKPYSLLGFSGTAGYSVVNQTTGSALFYWQVNKVGLDIDTDTTTPLVIWLEGGPGCSSEMAVLLESGPWYVNETTKGLEVRNQTWAQDYHLLYLDAPTGVGFSVLGSGDEYISTTQQYVQQVYTAIQGIAEDHSA
jgi:carboxypeptidase C (cathepsin A)